MTSLYTNGIFFNKHNYIRSPNCPPGCLCCLGVVAGVSDGVRWCLSASCDIGIGAGVAKAASEPPAVVGTSSAMSVWGDNNPPPP